MSRPQLLELNVTECRYKILLNDLAISQPCSPSDSRLRGIEPAAVTVPLVQVTFAIKSGANLAVTASDLFSGEIPPGGRWYFVGKILLESNRLVYLTRSEAVELNCTARVGSEHEDVRKTLSFEPLFGPFSRNERNAWEKIHGKRQR